MTASNVVESNEFHNCVVKVEDGVTFQYNKMYPGDQTYVYSIRPNNLEGTVVAPNNYWGSDNPDFSALIDKSRAPNGSVDYFPYYSDVALGTLIYKMVTISEDTVWATPPSKSKGHRLGWRDFDVVCSNVFRYRYHERRCANKVKSCGSNRKRDH